LELRIVILQIEHLQLDFSSERESLS